MGGKASTPPAPDYLGLAQEQGQISSNLLNQQTQANRPNQVTPWGNMTWQQGQNGQWTGTQTLTPQEQSTLSGQQKLQGQAVGAAGNLFSGAGLGTPLNFSNGPQVQSGQYYNPQAQNAVWGEFQSMQQPLQQQQMEQQQSQLEAQGLRPGDPAYNTAMTNLSNTQYQQQQSAEDQAVLAGEQEAQTMQGMDVQAQNQYMNEMAGQQTGNLNLFNSLMGSQQNQLAMPNFSQSGVAETPNLVGAEGQTYGAELNTTNANNAAAGQTDQAIGTLAGDAIAYFF